MKVFLFVKRLNFLIEEFIKVFVVNFQNQGVFLGSCLTSKKEIITTSVFVKR